MIFPDGANELERGIQWVKIGEITDADFGFRELRERTNKIRFCVRVLIFNDENELRVLESEKFGYVEIPGGGIEEGECILEALRREAREETGLLIKDIEPVGYLLEKRESVKNAYDWDKSISFVFKAKPEKEVGTEYTEEEKAEGFKPIWIKPDDFMARQKEEDLEVKSYGGHFSVRRDLMIAQYLSKNSDSKN